MNKVYISAQQLLESSFLLADQVFSDGFRPSMIIGVWRGGAPIGIAVQEFYEYKGVATDHISVRTASYTGINQSSRDIQVHGLHYLLENISHDDRVLIVDDVFDTGRSVEALLQEIRLQAGDRFPSDIRIACAWYKPNQCLVDFKPHYFVHQSDDWLVFPHELYGLKKQEITQGKTDLSGILNLF